MSLLQAILLGIVQGLTEFLPVSSSGHIELAQAVLGMESLKEKEATLSVALHAATALSTVVVFRKEVRDIFRGLFRFRWNKSTRFSFLILLSMIPAAAVGVFFDQALEQLFDGKLLLVGCMLLVTAGLLFAADSMGQHLSGALNGPKAVLIGIAQMFAILPGISRSGATISTSLLLNIDRATAARFSFLMVVPLILGKTLLDLKEEMDMGFQSWEGMETALLAGFIAAFFTGWIACKWMVRLVQNSRLSHFSWYCLAVGSIAIVHSLFF